MRILQRDYHTLHIPPLWEVIINKLNAQLHIHQEILSLATRNELGKVYVVVAASTYKFIALANFGVRRPRICKTLKFKRHNTIIII
jgi:hypothetical protein